MYRPLMKMVAKVVAEIVDWIAENLIKYMHLGDGMLGEVRGGQDNFRK